MRKTDIHQFTFMAYKEQLDRLVKFAKTKGESLYDAKLTIKEEIEDTNYVKVHLKINNCGPNIASRRLAEFILEALKD